jgi:hypothetical protein
MAGRAPLSGLKATAPTPWLLLRHFPIHADPAISRDEITTGHTGVYLYALNW